MERSRVSSVYLGRSGVAAGVVLRTCVTTTLGLALAALPRRVAAQRWIRYRIDLTGALPPVSPDVRLTRVTDDFIDMLRHHPEQAKNRVRSALRFWDRGMRRAYVWLSDEGPLCMQWLLTQADGSRIHRLGEWAGMYPPLAPHTGQVENLFAFANVRKRGVATQFEYALYHTARRLGLTQLVTHIHESNSAARDSADRTGWQRCGTITRYLVDLPGLRSRGVFVHRSDEPTSGLMFPSASVRATRTA
jgi:GNAT superfamily N-acetyltransferase